MKTQARNEKSNYRFSFEGLDSDSDLMKEVNLKLVQLLALAPPAATASGTLKRGDRLYESSIEILSPYRVFSEKAVGLTAHSSLKRVFDKIEDCLYRWRFGGSGDANPAHFPHFKQPQAQG